MLIQEILEATAQYVKSNFLKSRKRKSVRLSKFLKTLLEDRKEISELFRGRMQNITETDAAWKLESFFNQLHDMQTVNMN